MAKTKDNEDSLLLPLLRTSPCIQPVVLGRLLNASHDAVLRTIATLGIEPFRATARAKALLTVDQAEAVIRAMRSGT